MNQGGIDFHAAHRQFMHQCFSIGKALLLARKQSTSSPPPTINRLIFGDCCANQV